MNVVGNSIKCGFFVALFAVSSIVLFTGSSVSAVSDWDNTISTIDMPPSDMGGTVSGRNNTNPIFVLDQWYNIAYDQTEGFTRSGSGMGNAGQRIIIDGFNDTFLGNTEGQYVVTHYRSPSGHNETRFYYTSNLTTSITPLSDGSFGLSSLSEWSLIRYFDDSLDGSNRRVHINRNTTNSSDRISTANRVIFYEDESYLLDASDNLNIEYPEGYAGATVEELLEETNKVTHKPNITWSVNDKDVIVYSDDAKNTAVLEDYQIYWFISNTSFDTNQPSEPFALSGCTPPNYNNNFTVPIHFDYGVQAYYADKDCNILQVDDEGNRLSDNMEVLTIDGSTFDGSTTDHEAIIGEIEENEILKAIRKFRPNDGGLAGLIYAPIEAVATLPTIVGSCSPITLPLLGEEISLECIRPTIQASPMGVVYNTISVIITGVVTWWVAWRTFGTIKNIQDPQDDRVEVLKL